LSTNDRATAEASNVVRLATAVEGRYLGPAEVIATRPDQLELRLPTGRLVRARSALAFPYEAAVGDELLVIGEASEHYVIGVLRGRGRTELAFDGDVDLRSRDGRVRISGDRGVSLEGPEVDVHAERYSVFAELASTVVSNLRQSVRELFTLRAKEHHTMVERDLLQHSKRARVVAEEKVTVNGKEIFLG
jgi:hypothetical protein